LGWLQPFLPLLQAAPARVVDGHSDPYMHSSSTSHGRPPLVEFKMHSDANIDMKRRVSCFSLQLNFNGNDSTLIRCVTQWLDRSSRSRETRVRDSLAKSDQNTLKVGIHSFRARRSAFKKGLV